MPGTSSVSPATDARVPTERGSVRWTCPSPRPSPRSTATACSFAVTTRSNSRARGRSRTWPSFCGTGRRRRGRRGPHRRRAFVWPMPRLGPCLRRPRPPNAWLWGPPPSPAPSPCAATCALQPSSRTRGRSSRRSSRFCRGPRPRPGTRLRRPPWPGAYGHGSRRSRPTPSALRSSTRPSSCSRSRTRDVDARRASCGLRAG